MKIQFDTPPSSAQESNGLSVRYAASKRQVPRWRWYLLLAMVLTPPAYLLGRFAVAYWWETTPGLVVTEQTVLRAVAPGQVIRVADTGTKLLAGQVLMETKKDIPAAMQSMQQQPAAPANLQTTSTSFAGTLRDPLAERLSAQEEVYRLALQQQTLQQQRLQALQSLRAEGAATRGEVDGAQAQLLQTQAEVSRTKAAAQETRLAIAQARMTVASASPAPVDVGAKQQTGSQSDIAAPAHSRMPAPFDLTIVRQLVRSGEHVEAGTDIAVVQSTANLPLVHAYLPPSQAKYAQPGRFATLHFMDGGRVRAEVQDVISEAERIPAERVSPLTPRMPSIVVRLRPQEPLPAHYRIHHLPLDVRFDWAWGQSER